MIWNVHDFPQLLLRLLINLIWYHSLSTAYITELVESIKQQPHLSEPATATSTGSENELSATRTSKLVVTERELESVRRELNRARDENTRLHEKLVVAMDPGLGADPGNAGLPSDETKLKSALIRSQRDVVRGSLSGHRSIRRFIICDSR